MGHTYVTGETSRNSVLVDTVKNYRPVSLPACKQSFLVLNSNRKTKARVARAMVARGQVARGQVASREVARGPPCGKRAMRTREEAKKEYFVLRTYIVGGVGVKKLHID